MIKQHRGLIILVLCLFGLTCVSFSIELGQRTQAECCYKEVYIDDNLDLDGRLLVWGIPGVGSIPVRVPRKSSQSEKKVSETKVKDKTYQALRFIEIESDKITVQDKELFLQELNAQVVE